MAPEFDEWRRSEVVRERDMQPEGWLEGWLEAKEALRM
jgi:hypothetical protein